MATVHNIKGTSVSSFQIGKAGPTITANAAGILEVADGAASQQPIGYNTIPIYEIDAADIFDVAHAGMMWHKDAGAAVTFTCDNVAAIPQGTSWAVHNDDTEDLTIAQGAGVTINYLTAGGAPTAGNVTVEQGGIVTVYKYTDTEYWVWGDKEAFVQAAAATVTVADTASTSTFITMTDNATGDEALLTDAGLTYNATTAALTATTFVGALTGNADTATTAAAWTTTRTINITGDITSDSVNIDGSGNITITNSVVGNDSHTHDANNLTGTVLASGVVTSSLTSVGTLTSLQVDNLNLNGNTLSSTAGTDLLITPLAGQQLILDGTIVIDAGVVTGATSITSTAFVGALTGNADTATSAAGWTTGRTITLSGDVSGTSPAWDGTGNLAFSGTVVANDSHTHDANNLTGTTLASGVTASSLTSVGTLTTLTMGGDIAMGGNDIDNGGVVFLTEQASANVDVAGKGQFWVRNDVPNTPMFTDDNGDDFFLNNRVEADYQYDSTTTAADPGSGQVRFNSVTIGSITSMYIDDLSSNGSEEWAISNLADGDIIVIRDAVQNINYIIASVNGSPTDNTGWWTVPLTLIHTGSIFTNNAKIRLSFQWFSQAGAGGTVTSSGTPLNNEVAVFATATDINSDSTFTWDGTTLEATQFAGIAKANLLDKTAAETLSGAGTWIWSDNKKIQLGTSNGAQMWHDGTGDMFVNMDAAGEIIHLQTGTVDRLTVSSTGVDISVALTATSYGGITEANLVDKTATEAITGTWTLDGAVTTSDYGTGGRVKDGTDVSRPIGFNTIPVYEIDANDTFDLAHVGMLWHKDLNAAVTFTCNNDATIPQGASYMVHNDDTEDLTIAEGTATIEFLSPGAAPVGGNVTVEQGGIVTVYKYTDAIFWVWGAKAAAAAANITVADESTDTTCFPIFTTAATGDLPPKSGSNLTFNSSTGNLVATQIAGIANAQLVAKNATETISGAWSFTSTSRTQGTGLSTSWGSTSGTSTGAFNTVMGAASSATWLVSGTSTGVFRGGLQILDSGTTWRLYASANYVNFSGSALSINGGASLTTNTGTVTAVNNGNGMNFTNITTSGTVTMGTPGSLTGSTTNAVTTSSHTHAITSITAAKVLAGSLPTGVNPYITATGTSSNYRMIFRDASDASGNSALFNDSAANFYYNPSTNVLYCPEFRPTTRVQFNDNVEARFGTGGDVDMYFNGTDFYTDMPDGADWRLRGGAANDTMIVAFDDGSVQLYHNGGAEFGTQQHELAGNTAGSWTYDHAGTNRDVGFNDLKLVSNNPASVAVVEENMGGVIYADDNTTFAVSLPSSTTSFPIGGVITIINANTSVAITVTDQASYTCFYLDGSTRTDIAGTASIAAGGVATIWRQTTGGTAAERTWLMWGSGITP